jgi:hypothetical protein
MTKASSDLRQSIKGRRKTEGSHYKTSYYVDKHNYSGWERHIHVGGVRWCLWTAATNVPIVRPIGDIVLWVWAATVERYWRGKTEELELRPFPVSLCRPQIPHGLNQERTWASTMRGRRITAWTMARPPGQRKKCNLFSWSSEYSNFKILVRK